MSSHAKINLAALEQAELVPSKPFEEILSELKADLIVRAEPFVPEIARVLALESELTTILLEAFAYRELIKRAELNDAGRAVTLAGAQGAFLDHLAANFDVSRKIIVPADLAATPPVEAVLERDDDLRRRVQLAFEGITTAGSVGAYTFHALGAHPDVIDVSVENPAPGEVRVNVLAGSGDGTPAPEVLTAVEAALSPRDRRDLCALVSVAGAEVLPFEIVAELQIATGPDAALVLEAAREAVAAYVARPARLGQPMTLSGIYGALHREGVERVTLTAPATDIETTVRQAAYCSGITLSQGGVI